MGRFDDIINHEYVKSAVRKCMTTTERAAQFGAFRAVVGHDDEISETARLTDEKIELDESKKNEINHALNFVIENPKERVSVIHFVSDDKKQGGAYSEKKGLVVKIDKISRELVFDDHTTIHIDDIFKITSKSLEISEYLG